MIVTEKRPGNQKNKRKRRDGYVTNQQTRSREEKKRDMYNAKTDRITTTLAELEE